MAALPLHSSRSSKGWQEGRLIVGICATLLFAAILLGYAFEWNQILYKSGNEKSIAIEDLSIRIGGAEDFGILGVPWCRSRKGLTVDWTRDDLIQGMKLFVSVYHTRPIKHNIGGMRFDHSFGLWFLARRLQPQLVIESGAFKGHSTWVIRQALPNIPIISITPRHPQKYLKKGPAYVDMNCKYFSGKDFIDFGNIQWESILEEYNIVDKSKVLLFFDDHQSELKRLKQALRSGFQNLIFEDNYDTGTGDHYSMRQICDQGFIKGGGHSCEEGSNEIRLRASRKGQWDMAVDAKQLCGHDGAWWGVRGQMVDNFNHNMTKISAREHYENGKMVESVLDLYWELPPVASLKLTNQTRYDPARTSDPIIGDDEHGLFMELGLGSLNKSLFNGYTQMVYIKVFKD